MTSPYPPLAPSRPTTAHVTPAHHYLALAAGGAFARSRTDTGWQLTLNGRPASPFAALTVSVLTAEGLITWIPIWPAGKVSALTGAGNRQLRTWEHDLNRATT